MKIKYRNNRPTITFAFAELPYYNIDNIKPHHVRTYCDCKCVEISSSGYGTMELCGMHEIKVRCLKPGTHFIPKMVVDTPLTIKGELELFFTYYLRCLQKAIRGLRNNA